MNHRIIHIKSILRQERHLMAQSEIVKLETELQQLKQGENMEKTQIWIEQNCECGISEKTGKWSEKVFELFGCNCETEQNQ